jgi:hypothetical protein
VAGLRLPVIIGVGQEELEQDDLEIVRGSSSNLDEQIVAEDISESWVVDETNPANPILGAQNGSLVKFKVKNIPIVDGQGFGRVSNDVRSVTVTVNGIPVAVGSVQGAKGYVILQVPTQPTDVVRCTYFFHRGDTAFSDDVSDQVTSTGAVLISPGFEPYAITTGSSDTFTFNVNGADKTVVFTNALAATAAQLKAQIDALVVPGLSTSVFVDNEGRSHLQLNSAVSLSIGSGNANGPLGWTPGTATSRNVTFRVFQRPIVDGSSGGVTTTDPSKVVVKVNGTQVLATAVDGKNGLVTLPTPPAAGSTVTVDYFANTWQDTFDYLPNTLVTSVIRAGISPGRSDYIQNQDFVVSNPSPDVSIVHWGTSFSVASSTRQNPASAAFDGTQIKPSLVDDKLYSALCTRVVDTSVVPSVVSTNQFTLPEVPTTGNGRDTPLGLPLFNSVTNGRFDLETFRPDLIVVHTGRNLLDALNRPAAKVVAVEGQKITLKDSVSPDHNAYATFWYNRIVDDTYVLTCKVAGGVGAGQYEVFSSVLNENLFQVRFGTKGSGLTETVNWPRGVEQIPDAFHVGVTGAVPVSEVVTVTFGSSPAENAVYTNKAAEPYSFFAGTSATWVTRLNGATSSFDVSTTLSGAGVGYLVGAHVPVIQSGPDTGKITVPVSPNNVLKLTIDTGSVTGATNAQTLDVDVALTAGNRTPTQICTDINTALSAALTAELGSTTVTLANFVQVGGLSTSDVIFYIKSFSTPASLPDGFDAVSYAAIRQGTAEGVLGFTAFQRADGTTGAICKPATLLASKTGPFVFTTGLNDTFKFRMNGIDYTVTIPNSATSVADVITAITSVISGVATNGTLGNLGHLRLTSTTNNESSSLLILDGNANSTLGFTENQLAVQTKVKAQEVCDKLNATSGWLSKAIAYPSTFAGEGTFITIESITTGAAGSSVGFTDSANSAFNITTGVNITPGVDGDNGEDAMDNFTVSSSNPSGSSGTGVPGQTYTDSKTGLRFSVLPATDGSYTSGGTFTLLVSQTFDVSPTIPTYAVPGCETLVYNTVNVGVNDTAQLQTFNPGGQEPKNGDFYFISYRFLKQDFSTRIFRQFKTIEANYGPASPENRVTLAALLQIQNGAVLVGIKQVLKVPNTNQASVQSFLTAIDDLATPLPGNIKPDIIVPLATDTSIYSFLTQHCEIQSNIRNQGERMGFFGFASGTTPTVAQAVAKSLNSNRMIAIYPDSAVITLQNELGQSFESPVDGSFLAAAVAGAIVSPAVDVATPYTRRSIQGITRLIRILDPVEANQTAVAGITLLEDLQPLIRIRQGLTTNMTSILTRLPTVTQISDFVQQQSRGVLDTFAGTKFLLSRTNEVEVSLTSLFKSLVQQEIVAAFTGIAASVDASDPTIMDVEAFYQPIFPLLYLVLTFNLRSRI